jgi:hypothetical protein
MEDDLNGAWRVIVPSKEGRGSLRLISGQENSIRRVVCVPVGFAGRDTFPKHSQLTAGTPPVAAQQMGHPQTRYGNFVLIYWEPFHPASKRRAGPPASLYSSPLM